MDKQTFISFENMHNFRDIGGFVLEDGHNMKLGAVFRSEDLSRMSTGDQDKLKELGIKCIIDLRTPNERFSKPYEISGDTNMYIVHIPILCEEKDLSRWQFFCFLIREGRNLDFEQYMRRFYNRLAFDRTEQTKNILTLLSNERNVPALIHCTGGKDRTGLIAALLQLIMGVPRETVIQSYLASSKAIAYQMKSIEKYIRWMSLGQVSPERIRPMLEVRKEYLEGTLNEIFHRYKSLDTYLTIGCGMDKCCLERLRKLLTEEGNSQAVAPVNHA